MPRELKIILTADVRPFRSAVERYVRELEQTRTVFQRRRLNNHHHRETPALSAMHARYYQRRRARRRRK